MSEPSTIPYASPKTADDSKNISARWSLMLAIVSPLPPIAYTLFAINLGARALPAEVVTGFFVTCGLCACGALGAVIAGIRSLRRGRWRRRGSWMAFVGLPLGVIDIAAIGAAGWTVLLLVSLHFPS